MAIRRPWEPTDDDVVYVGGALETLSAEQWDALDYWMGYLAAAAFQHPDLERRHEGAAYLGLVGKLKVDLVHNSLPEARKRAKVEFDPRKLVRMEDIPLPGVDDEEPTAEELAEAAARVARSEGAVKAHTPVSSKRKR